MLIIRAEEMGLCFGVRDALRTTDAVRDPTLVTIHGELVHNPRVARRLGKAGFRQSPEDSRGSAPTTPLVLITAHGVSDAERRRLAVANKELIDTTCPLVRRVHDAAQELQAEGRASITACGTWVPPGNAMGVSRTQSNWSVLPSGWQLSQEKVPVVDALASLNAIRPSLTSGWVGSFKATNPAICGLDGSNKSTNETVLATALRTQAREGAP